MRKVTIEDISRHTGLSRGTVSRALNDRPDISNQTKQRVLEACRTLDYVPSHAARSLATGRSFAIAALINCLHDPVTADTLRGALSHAEAIHYAVHVVELSADDTQRVQRLRGLAADRIDGVLLCTTLTAEHARMLRERVGDRLLAATAPLDATPDDGAPLDVFAVDQAEIGRLIGRFLRAAGGDGAYLHDGARPGARERLAGVEEVLRTAGVDPQRVVTPLSAAAGPIGDALDGRAGALRAVAADDDLAAVSAMLALAQRGRAIGRDVAVLGVGNHPAGQQITPALSTIDPCAADAGRRAFETLVQRVSGQREDRPVTTWVAPRLVQRESSRNLPVSA